MRARADVRQGGLRRLLHYIPQLAGQCQLAFPVDYSGFGAQNRAANFGPRQASNQSDLALFMRQRVTELNHAKEVGDIRTSDGNRIVLTFFNHLAGDFATDIGNLALEIAHSSFARVSPDQRSDGVVGELYIFLRQTSL